jgi:hypothetical protein
MNNTDEVTKILYWSRTFRVHVLNWDVKAYFPVRKLINTNKNIMKFFYRNNLYWYNFFLSMYSLINTVKKILSVYIKRMTMSITKRLKKKTNHIVTWYFYQQNDRWSYWHNNFVNNVISDISFMTWRSTLFSPFLISPFLLSIFFCNKQTPPPLNLNTIQPPITNSATTILSLSTSAIWFKFY